MHEQLFDQIDMAPENIHIPDGTVPKEEIDSYCIAYEQQIEEAGGIDLQILGIGSNGQIGFNEPGSNRNSATRLIALDNNNRLANSFNLPTMAQVPRLAMTSGVSIIMKSGDV